MRIHVLISGQVQGVFFRAYTKEKADELGVKGWVRNTKAGRVEAVFEGGKDKVEEMIKWCGKGSPGSKVKKVEISRGEVEEVYPPSLCRSSPERRRASAEASARQGGFEIRY